tara:strand:+ start:2062 stop:2349 length:288 start_codon:yes stop_codon:yes gene_type:complete
MRPNSIDDYVFICLLNGKWWTFWDLQKTIREKVGRLYGEPSISAAIRDIRKIPQRNKYNLPMTGEVIDKRRIEGGKGYEYKLAVDTDDLRRKLEK